MIVIIYGGTGTLGQHVVPLLLKDPQVGRIRIFSRSEHKQAEMADLWKTDKVDFLLGDIRDKERVRTSMKGVDQVYHFAATKRVEAAEYNMEEAKSVNIDGTENIIRSIWDTPTIHKAMFTSTDKACAPLNFYGASKLVAERYWIGGNRGISRTRFSACRYGNVLGSQGSVIETWSKLTNMGKTISVTDGEMTRFFISPSEAASFVVSSMREMQGGEIFVPYMKSTTMNKLGAAFLRTRGIESPVMDFIPMRPGEKKHEVLISEDQVPNTTMDGDKFVQWPEFNFYPVSRRGQPVKQPLTSFNTRRFTDEELEVLCLQK